MLRQYLRSGWSADMDAARVQQLVFVAIVAMLDPLRDEVRVAIRMCNKVGIRDEQRHHHHRNLHSHCATARTAWTG